MTHNPRERITHFRIVAGLRVGESHWIELPLDADPKKGTAHTNLVIGLLSRYKLLGGDLDDPPKITTHRYWAVSRSGDLRRVLCVTRTK